MSVNYTDNYIQGNVYAITGGGSGFGQATAIEIVKMGGCVSIMGRRYDKLLGTVEAVRALGKEENILAFEGDVARYEDNVAFVKATVEKFGKLDAFFANAGIMPNACFKDHKIAVNKWDQCIDINLKGNLYGICASYDQFKAQGWGHFLTTSSIHGNFPTSGAGVYSATKVAVRYLAKALAMENHGTIKTTVINPPGVTTTELFGTVVRQEGTDGIVGPNFPVLMNALEKIQSGEDTSFADPDSIHYITPNTDDMVRSIMYALNQPKGMSVAEVTMYPSNNIYLI